MKAENTSTGHTRNIQITEIEGGEVENLVIRLDYGSEANVLKAITLDNIVIPAIIKAINQNHETKNKF